MRAHFHQRQSKPWDEQFEKLKLWATMLSPDERLAFGRRDLSPEVAVALAVFFFKKEGYHFKYVNHFPGASPYDVALLFRNDCWDLVEHYFMRQTGRTFRALRRCFDLARNGAHVCYVVHAHNALDYTVNLVRRHQLDDEFLVRGPRLSFVHQFSGGSVHFSLPANLENVGGKLVPRELLGKPYNDLHVEVDHHVAEHRRREFQERQGK